jgi:hypothetical protein
MAITTPEVVQEMAFAVYNDVMNRKDVIAVDRKEMPLLDKLFSNMKEDAGQAGGQTTVLLKTAGNQDIQFWERRDVLGFTENYIDLSLAYSFYNIHMGLEVVHHDLLNEGYTIVYNGPRGKNFAKKNSADELNRLADILQEKIETHLDNWKVKLDLAFHRDGTYDTKAIPGLDALVSLTPTVGTIGGKSRSNPVLQNTVATGATTTNGGNLYTKMVQTLRACNLNGRGRGARVDTLVAGSAFIDGYTAWRQNNNFYVQTKASSIGKIDIGIADGDLEFMGMPIVYDPTMDYLDTIESPTFAWSKRCYFLASKAIGLRSPSGMNGQFSAPTDPSDQRFSRFSSDGRYAMVDTVPNAHGCVVLN